MEKTSFQDETDADVRAAEQMAKLYDLIIADNPSSSKTERHQLNVFLTRLLFCLFAEDTGIFPSQLFTNSINSFSQSDGSDVGQLIQDIFLVLSTEPTSRKKIKPHLAEFPYVNGGLFNDAGSKRLVVPKFTSKSRLKLIDLGGKSWKEINPDIFGSMFQGVVDAEVRADLGMHYTSVPNIMKVIKPLFLDDLYEEFERAKGSEGKLSTLLDRIYCLRFFDPACGSGNFLIIAYKELRKLEMAIFKALQTITTKLPLSGIHVSQFYGIEIDDLAHEVAILALWLAEHQMNVEFKEAFGKAPASLPLKDGAKIVCGNAANLIWKDVCPIGKSAGVVVMGNPPYLGSSLQEECHKADMARVFAGKDDFKNLDYISCWFLKAAEYLKGTKNRCAFVSTNSICQGEQVSMLWPHILKHGIKIAFAHLSFRWANNAKSKAAVTCVIIGLQDSPSTKTLYDGEVCRVVENINPYLINYKDLFVTKRRKPISRLQPMDYGSKPSDGGNLLLSIEDKNRLLEQYPELEKVIHPFVGAEDYIAGIPRYCLWFSDEQAAAFKNVPEIKRRLQAVRAMRLASKKPPTVRDAQTPHRFSECRYERAASIIIPRHSSERRMYIPFGYLNSDVVVADSASAIYGAEPWIFAIISSRMHMVWVKTVAGRIKTDIRYSSTICYNNFPFPDIDIKQKKKINQCAESVLLVRQKYPAKSLADLYDPDLMPVDLLSAHQILDQEIERCYRPKSFSSDEERAEVLFGLYEEMASRDCGDEKQPTLLGIEL
jgi:hypothetical protein